MSCKVSLILRVKTFQSLNFITLVPAPFFVGSQNSSGAEESKESEGSCSLVLILIRRLFIHFHNPCPVQYGNNVSATYNGAKGCCGPCCCFTTVWMLIGCPCLVSYNNRREIRQKYVQRNPIVAPPHDVLHN